MRYKVEIASGFGSLCICDVVEICTRGHSPIDSDCPTASDIVMITLIIVHVLCVLSPQSNFNVAVLNVGAPAAGMNAAVRSAVRVGISEGHKMFAVSDGFEGLYKGQVGIEALMYHKMHVRIHKRTLI